MRKIIGWVTSHPKSVISIWIIIVGSMASFALKLPSVLSEGGFSSPNSQSAYAQQIISDHFPQLSPQSLIVVLRDKKALFTTPVNQIFVSDLTQRLKVSPGVANVESTATSSASVFSGDGGHATFLNVRLTTRNDSTAQNLVSQITTVVKKGLPAGDQAFVTGGPALGQGLNVATQQDVTSAERIAFPLLIVVLLFVLRSVMASMLPLVIAGFVLPVTMGLSYFISRGHQLNILLTNAISMIGLGVIIDYCVFIISRYRTELMSYAPGQAVHRSLYSAGRAVFYSGMTVIVSLTALFLPTLTIFTSIALGGVLVVIVSVIAAWTLLPALLVLLGPRINALKIGRRPNLTKGNLGWYRWTTRLMKQPVGYFFSGVVLLAILAIPVMGLKMQVPVASASQLPASASSRQGLDFLTKHFAVGNLFPVQVVLSASGTFDTVSNLATIASATNNLSRLPDVKTISGPTSWAPNMSLAGYLGLYHDPSTLNPGEMGAISRWVYQSKDRWYAIITITPGTSANDARTHALIGAVRNQLSNSLTGTQMTSWVGGQNATGYDFDASVIGRFPEIIAAVFLITALVLAWTFRSLVIPLQAIVLNALVTLASLGVLVAIFQMGFGNIVANPAPINSVTPVIVFAVLFGLSMDYEVFIVSRIRERYDNGDTLTESIALGVSDTARLVTGAAAIMIAVFVAFALTPLGVVQQLGIALATAIFLDALVVRTILVPTIMRIFGSTNWWFPIWRPKTSSCISVDALPEKISTGGGF